MVWEVLRMQSWVCWRGVGTWRQARHASCTAHSKRILNALPLICTRTESLRKRTTPGSQPISARTARTSSVEAGCVWWWRRWHLGWGSTRGTSMRSCMQVSAPSCASSFPSLSFPFLSFPSPPSLFLLILSSPLHSLTHMHHACHSFPFLSTLSFPFLFLSFPSILPSPLLSSPLLSSPFLSFPFLSLSLPSFLPCFISLCVKRCPVVSRSTSNRSVEPGGMAAHPNASCFIPTTATCASSP